MTYTLNIKHIACWGVHCIHYLWVQHVTSALIDPFGYPSRCWFGPASLNLCALFPSNTTTLSLHSSLSRFLICILEVCRFQCFFQSRIPGLASPFIFLTELIYFEVSSSMFRHATVLVVPGNENSPRSRVTDTCCREPGLDCKNYARAPRYSEGK